MYLAIDVGGSKILMAVFNESGYVEYQKKIKTSSDYATFLEYISNLYNEGFKNYKIDKCCCAVPGEYDIESGVVKRFGNLPWQNVKFRSDISRVVGMPVLIENDANLGGLSEATLIKDKIKRVLYLTLSRGIGGKILVDGKISKETRGAEVGFMVFEHNGQLTEWEEFASGHALFQQYGKHASEIEDPEIWAAYAKNVAVGLRALLPVWQPEVVIFGGGVGNYFEKFAAQLDQELSRLKSHMVTIPPMVKAKRPEEAVIYGCYEFIKQHL